MEMADAADPQTPEDYGRLTVRSLRLQGASDENIRQAANRSIAMAEAMLEALDTAADTAH